MDKSKNGNSGARLIIKELAAKRSFSLYKLSQVSGVAYPIVYRLANGQTTGIQFDKLEALAEALSVRPSELVAP